MKTLFLLGKSVKMFKLKNTNAANKIIADIMMLQNKKLMEILVLF